MTCPECQRLYKTIQSMRRKLSAVERVTGQLRRERAELKRDLETAQAALSCTLAKRSVGRVTTDERIALAVRLRAKGYSVSDIAELMGYTRQRIYQFLEEDAPTTKRAEKLSENLTLRVSQKVNSLIL
jgi:hypothetical protein